MEGTIPSSIMGASEGTAAKHRASGKGVQVKGGIIGKHQDIKLTGDGTPRGKRDGAAKGAALGVIIWRSGPPVAVARPAAGNLSGDAPPYFSRDGSVELGIDGGRRGSASPSRNACRERAKGGGSACVWAAVAAPSDGHVLDILAF